MTFEDDIKAQYEAPKPTDDVTVLLNGTAYTFRFTQMDGVAWASAADQAVARPGVLIDTYTGYNLRALTLLVAPQTGKRIDGDTLVDLTPDQWRNLFKGLPGASVAKICDAVFKLNHIGPAEAVEDAKKALADASAKK